MRDDPSPFGGEAASNKYCPGEMPRFEVLAFVLRTYLFPPAILTAEPRSGCSVAVEEIGLVRTAMGSSRSTSGVPGEVTGGEDVKMKIARKTVSTP
jgi:hypothetical protein